MSGIVARHAAVAVFALVSAVLPLPGPAYAETPTSVAPAGECPGAGLPPVGLAATGTCCDAGRRTEAAPVGGGVRCATRVDFGDAPSSYLVGAGESGHRLAGHGARLLIGTTVDGDPAGTASAGADRDDRDRPVDDEDGVLPGTVIDLSAPTLTVPVVNTTGAVAILAGWLDFDRDGTFGAAERALVRVPPGAASAALSWPAAPPAAVGTPAALAAAGGPAVPRKSFLRLRIMPGAYRDPGAGGYVDGGEIEDHEVALTSSSIDKVARPVRRPDGPEIGTVLAGNAVTGDDGGWLPVTGTPAAAYTRLGLGLAGFGGSVLGLAWLLGRRRREEISPGKE